MRDKTEPNEHKTAGVTAAVARPKTFQFHPEWVRGDLEQALSYLSKVTKHHASQIQHAEDPKEYAANLDGLDRLSTIMVRIAETMGAL